MSARPDRRSQDLTPQPTCPHRATPFLNNPRPPSERCTVLRATLTSALCSSPQSSSPFPALCSSPKAKPLSSKPPHCPESSFPALKTASQFTEQSPFPQNRPTVLRALLQSSKQLHCLQSSAPVLEAAPPFSELFFRPHSSWPFSELTALMKSSRSQEPASL